MITKKSNASGIRSLVQQLRHVKETRSARQKRRRAALTRAIEHVQSPCLISSEAVIGGSHAIDAFVFTCLAGATDGAGDYFAPIRERIASMALRKSDMVPKRSAGAFFKQRWTS